MPINKAQISDFPFRACTRRTSVIGNKANARGNILVLVLDRFRSHKKGFPNCYNIYSSPPWSNGRRVDRTATGDVCLRRRWRGVFSFLTFIEHSASGWSKKFTVARLVSSCSLFFNEDVSTPPSPLQLLWPKKMNMKRRSRRIRFFLKSQTKRSRSSRRIHYRLTARSDHQWRFSSDLGSRWIFFLEGRAVPRFSTIPTSSSFFFLSSFRNVAAFNWPG